MSFIYLASPYTGSPEIMEQRFRAVEAYTASLIANRIVVYSPIVHSHALSINHNLHQEDGEFWWTQNKGMLMAASGIHVLQLKGWLQSDGVTREVQFAVRRNLPVKYVLPIEVTE